MEWLQTIEEPDEYSFEEIITGQKKQFKVIITESMINDFAELSGDYNPLHMNDSYAKSTKFKQRVCHGLLLTSFFSQLIGMFLPGKNSLYLSQTVKFVSPCFINDEIIVEGKVIDKSSSTKIITLKTTITNTTGNRLIDGQAKVLVR